MNSAQMWGSNLSEEPEMCTEGPEEEVLVLSDWLLRFSFCVRKGELGIAIFCLSLTLK